MTLFTSENLFAAFNNIVDQISALASTDTTTTSTQPASTKGKTITGAWTQDELYGTSGDDTILGPGGDDVLKGGAGADGMMGGEGDDEIWGSNHANTTVAQGSTA